MIANGIPVLPYVTTNLLKSADIFEKTEWKISTTTDTTWRSYQLEVKDLRNNILPLWDALVKLVGKGADGSIKSGHFWYHLSLTIQSAIISYFSCLET